MNYGKEFEKYAMSDHNVSSSKLNYYEKQIENSLTPYILEERELRATQMDIFSRLMMDKSDIKTVNTGMAASMGSVLLGAGTKGKRSSLRHSTTMLHQSSGGFTGNIQDAEIDWQEWQKVNKELFNLLGEYCGKTADEVMKDATRDFWLNAKEAKAYGIIDEIIGKS